MTDHANELRRHARKIPHPQGETPGVMLRAADEIERLRSESSRLHKEVDKFEDGIDWVQRALQAEAQIEAMEKQEPVAWCATDETGTVIEALGMNQSRRFDTALYLAPGALEQARLNGMGSEREAALLAKLEAAEKDIAVKEEVIDSLAAVVKRLDAQCDAAERERDECNRRRLEAAGHFAAQTALMKKKYDDLRAKVAAMEKQEPECEVVGQVHNVLYEVRTLKYDLPAGTKLYALPGAQGEGK